ncbi:unnamed protein product [Trichobilharzia regenti]|nr:unnamed protein product [Trichobilharzia regenti]
MQLPLSNHYNSPVDRKPSGLKPPVGEVIFKCASCNKSFASRSDVAVHYRHVHAQLNDSVRSVSVCMYRQATKTRVECKLQYAEQKSKEECQERQKKIL